MSTALPAERWSRIPGLPSEYEVSDLGRVRITVTRLPRRAGDILKARPSHAGIRVELSLNKVQKGFLVKVLVMRTFVPGFIDRDEVFYIDGNPDNCALSNLTTTPPRVPLPTPIAEDEEWRPFPVEEYKDRYLVSNYGRVCPTRWSKMFPSGGAKTPGVTKTGYLNIGVGSGEGPGKTFLLHRMVALAFLGEAPATGMVVDHIDRNRSNVHVSNLRWLTQKENHPLADDRFTDFRCLSHEDANEIRRRYNSGERQVDIAKDYGISQNQVSMCVLNKVWQRKNTVPIEKAPPFSPLKPQVEEWRPCPSYVWLEASNLGAVRYAIWTAKAGEILSQHFSNGYPKVQISLPGKVHSALVHRLVADAFFGPSRGRHVNHKNSDRSCAWVTNLEYVTPTGNMRHRFGYTYTTAE